MYQILFIFTKPSPSPPPDIYYLLTLEALKIAPDSNSGNRREEAEGLPPHPAGLHAQGWPQRPGSGGHEPHGDGTPRRGQGRRRQRRKKDGTRRRKGRRNGRNRTGRRGLSPVATGTGPVATRLSPVNARRDGGGSMRRDEECAAICSHNRHTFRAILTVNTANFATP